MAPITSPFQWSFVTVKEGGTNPQRLGVSSAFAKRLRSFASGGLLLGLPLASQAQQVVGWPRDTTSGEIAFVGLLPWPTHVRTPAQQQTLVRHWFEAKLTLTKPATVGHLATGEMTYAHLPTRVSFDSVTSLTSGAAEQLRLLYTVRLTATPHGLRYQLSNFICVWIGSDYSSSNSLEDVLQAPAVQPAQAILGSWRKRLQGAVTHW